MSKAKRFPTRERWEVAWMSSARQWGVFNRTLRTRAGTWPTKQQAVRDAVWFARQYVEKHADQGASAELRIKGRNGRIQDARTYPRSSDPRRSKG